MMNTNRFGLALANYGNGQVLACGGLDSKGDAENLRDPAINVLRQSLK